MLDKCLISQYTKCWGDGVFSIIASRKVVILKVICFLHSHKNRVIRENSFLQKTFIKH